MLHMDIPEYIDILRDIHVQHLDIYLWIWDTYMPSIIPLPLATLLPQIHRTDARKSQVVSRASEKSNKSSCPSRCWPSDHAAGKRPLLHGIFFLFFSNLPGVYKPPAVPLGAAQGAHYQAGTAGGLYSSCHWFQPARASSVRARLGEPAG